ncbi:MAG: gamma-glutamyltransferase [Rhodospirillaceae bacterium]|nr:gamma-glutamyltransferase [Rhodospirillaceae bacterium]
MTETPERWVVRKPALTSGGGVVATQHRAASEAGARVLAEGGNAVDAAIAASLALATVEPWMSGLGGGGFMLVRPAGDARTHAVSFGMVAPGALDPADYPLTGEAGADLFGWPAVKEDRNLRGPLAVAVPGQVAGLGLAHERFGTWSWADLVAPACALAEPGMAVDWHATVAIAASAPELASDTGCAAAYLADGFPLATPWTGEAPRIRLGRLAETLRRLGEAGPQDVYTGEIGRAICADMAALGGRLSAADLAAYQATIEEAPETRYRDARVGTAPGLTAGPTLVDVLDRLAASLDPGEAPSGGAYAAYAEALQAAYAERLRAMGAGTDADRASCTSHLGAADRDGTVVALTQTLLSPFGAKVMLPETGILLNNGIMWFDPRPGGPNSIAPGKRPLSNMCPTIVEFADGRRAALGASGGRRILPAVAQLLSFLVDFGMSLDDAAHCPRINADGANLIEADARLSAETLALLEARFALGVRPHGVHPSAYACPSAVVWDPQGGTASGAAHVMSPNACVGAP